MNRVLFLDFDGVLHPTSARPEERFSRVDVLAHCLAEHDCNIVVSSSWRFHHDFEALVEPLPAALQRRVTGVTGEVRYGRWPRHQEILAFLRESVRPVDWRALDDSFNEFPLGCPELIACDPNVGLDERTLHRLQQWLQQS